MANVTKAPASRSPPPRLVTRGPYTMGPETHDPADGVHDLRRCLSPLLVRLAVVALRRQPRVAEHRPRVRRPPRGVGARGGPRGPRRRPRRDRRLSRAGRLVQPLRALAG